jgi:sarcosine oxidase
VVLAAGPWVGEFVPGRFAVHRQVLHCFETATYEEHRDMPIFIWELGGGPDDFVYGFPAIDGPQGGVKVASEDYTATTTPDACDRRVSGEESERFHARYLEGRFPGLTKNRLRATTCLYTVTPDHGFVVEEREGVLLVSACSGHGFKHSAAIGEDVARRVAAEAA